MMSDRSNRLRELSEIHLRKKQEKAEKAHADLMDEVYENHREKRVMFDSDLKDRLYQKSNGVCVWCGQSLQYEDAAIDHNFPLSRGGANDEDNLQLLHTWCNQSKGASLHHLSRAEQIQYLADRFDD